MDCKLSVLTACPLDIMEKENKNPQISLVIALSLTEKIQFPGIIRDSS